MRIIISPAKKMNETDELWEPRGTAPFRTQTEMILSYLRACSYSELKTLWACSDKIALQTAERLETINLDRAYTPALAAYDGIQFRYMAPEVFEASELEYVQKHLRILSAFYGVLKPLDAVVPYRIEFNASSSVQGSRSLYQFWGDLLYKEVMDDSHILINLASKEYARAIVPHLKAGDRCVECVFAQYEAGKLLQKGVYAKIGRGEMVRYMAEQNITDPEAIKAFDRSGYCYEAQYSDENRFTFVRRKRPN